jgi:uncharacterized protein (TIGR02271 family)
VPDINTVRAWEGLTMVDRDGNPIGSINAIYLDDQTGQPEWALVNTGLFGTRHTFVPIAQAAQTGESVQVPYDKGLVKDAPRVDVDQHPSEAEEQQPWRHYGLDYDPDRRAASGDIASSHARAGRGVPGPTTDDAMTRSEEELRIGITRRERGRVRLRKFVTSEQVQQAIPVRRERVRLEHEPITDSNVDTATSGPDISEADHEVVLREEEPVVEKRVVPRERIRLGKETVTGEERVAENVRKEQIEVENEDTTGGGMGVGGAGSDRLQRTRLGAWTSAVITPSGGLLPGRRTKPSERGS